MGSVRLQHVLIQLAERSEDREHELLGYSPRREVDSTKYVSAESAYETFFVIGVALTNLFMFVHNCSKLTEKCLIVTVIEQITPGEEKK